MDLVDVLIYRGYQRMYLSLTLVETWMDVQAYMAQLQAWTKGLFAVGSLQGAHNAAAGLA